MLIGLRDGRKLGYAEYGDPEGVLALWFHGAGGSRYEAGFLDAPAKELGVRVVAPDRPGVGESSPAPGRTGPSYAEDVAQLLDALGARTAAVGGLSNGGMFTMAVASVLPERVTRAVPVNPASPCADPQARAHLSRIARTSYRLLDSKPGIAVKAVVKPPTGLAKWFSDRANPDARLLEDPVIAQQQRDSRAEVLRHGTDYLFEEVRLASGPWGFDHRAVPVEVVLLSGEKDAGLGYARRWVEELPNGRLETFPGGHLGLFAPAVGRRIAEVLAGRP